MSRVRWPARWRANTWVRVADARFPLSRAGLVAGALGGIAYTATSASHMVVPAPRDIYIVGLMLVGLGSCIGWLSGSLLRRPARDDESPPETARD